MLVFFKSVVVAITVTIIYIQTTSGNCITAEAFNTLVKTIFVILNVTSHSGGLKVSGGVVRIDGI